MNCVTTKTSESEVGGYQYVDSLFKTVLNNTKVVDKSTKKVTIIKVIVIKVIINIIHSTIKRTALLSFFIIALITLSATVFSTSAFAEIDVYEFNTPQQEAQYRALIDEFRCPKCQNQNLAGSDSQIAQDLKRKTYEMVVAGQSDAQIREYMYARYGDFISYKPPVRPSTWILWFFPPLLLLLLIGWWIWRQSRGSKQAIPRQGALVDREFNRTNDNIDAINIDTVKKPDISSQNSALSSDEQQALQALLSQYDNDDSKHDCNHNKHDRNKHDRNDSDHETTKDDKQTTGSVTTVSKEL